MACPKLAVSPGRVPRSVMANDPVPVGVQTTACRGPVEVSDQPVTWPPALIASAWLVVPPGRVPRSVTVVAAATGGTATIREAPATSDASTGPARRAPLHRQPGMLRQLLPI